MKATGYLSAMRIVNEIFASVEGCECDKIEVIDPFNLDEKIYCDRCEAVEVEISVKENWAEVIYEPGK